MTFARLSLILILTALTVTSSLSRAGETDATAASLVKITAAWEGLAANFSPSSPPDAFKEKQLSDKAIENLVTPNKKSIIIADYSGMRSGNPYVLCRFHCERPERALLVTWKGNGAQPFSPGAPCTVTVFIYDTEKRTFLKIHSESWNDKKTTHEDKTACTRLDMAMKYFGEGNDLYLLVLGPKGSGNSNSTLIVDYVGLHAE
jgi:hypothetical protein